MKKEKSYFKEIRIKGGFDQKKMAEKLGVSYSHYTKLETKHVKPSFDLLKKTKQIFPETDMNQFFK